jgi:hypothetical protein
MASRNLSLIIVTARASFLLINIAFNYAAPLAAFSFSMLSP